MALVALLLSVGAAMIWGIRGFTQSAGWVNHTHEVLAQIELVRSSVLKAETSARGYRLTSQRALEATYLVSRPRAIEGAGVLARLVSDNPVQEKRAQNLGRLVRGRLDELDYVLALYDGGRSNETINALRGTRGPQLMGEIDRAADQMLAEEERLLAKRSARTSMDAMLLTGFVAVGTALSLAMLAALLAVIRRETARAHALEREARNALGKLEASLSQREKLAEQRRVLSAFAGLLHSSQSTDEALDVAANALLQLVGHGSGVCYLMRASQNLLELRPLFGTRGADYPAAIRSDQCWGLRRGHTHLYDPSRPSAVCEHLRGMGADAARGACVPLATQGAVLGLLHVSGGLDEALGESELAAVESVAEHLSMVLHSLGLRESLRVQSLRDPLTHLYNRRYLEESLPREMERCLRRDRPLSALMIDVDHFKRFNDLYGHGAGDALLAKVGDVLTAATRGEDIACRYGGEEFTIVMPEAGLSEAAARAEQIRRLIGSASIDFMRRPLGPVTVSIGVAQMDALNDTPQLLLAAADRALYAAKAAGRDRVLRAPSGAGAVEDAAAPLA